MTLLLVGRTARMAAAGVGAAMATGALAEWHSPVAGAAAPTVTIAPAAGAYRDGQTVTVSVGPNRTFVPNTRVVILECADPGGAAAALPVSFSSCDGNTVQGDTVLVRADGSLGEPSYTLYALPSAALAEKPTWQPACNATAPCVLFVGEDQNDFTRPKAFSAPFTVTPAGTGGTAGDAGAGASPTTTTPSASVSLAQATLASTGTPGGWTWIVAVGALLAGSGVGGRRLARRRSA